MVKVSVVLPTYNERENIEKMVAELGRVLEDYEKEVLVVDDGSPDGTAELVRELSDDYGFLRLLEREEKDGLGSAYREGFRKVDGDVLVQLDADFSHPVERIPEMVERTRDFDVVVGSRYVDGGSRNDPVSRRILPLLGSFFYTWFIGSPVKDITSGFKAYRKECRQFLVDDSLPDGYSYQPGSLMSLVRRGFSTCEIPIEFSPREAGEPKFHMSVAWENLSLMLRLFFSRLNFSDRD